MSKMLTELLIMTLFIYLAALWALVSVVTAIVICRLEFKIKSNGSFEA